jgi:hypothetical protein
MRCTATAAALATRNRLGLIMVASFALNLIPGGCG